MRNSPQLRLGHMLVPVSVPRRLFYWATDPEHDIYVQFGSWTYLAMWKAIKNLLPVIEDYRDPHSSVESICESHAEWMMKDLGATEAELAGTSDNVEFVVSLPSKLIGTAWENGNGPGEGDYYFAGQCAIASIWDAWAILDQIYGMDDGAFRNSWMHEWKIEGEQS